MDKSILGTLILIFTGLVTYKAFIDQTYFDRYKFYVDGILIRKEYGRILSSGFLHANWIHFGFNMIALTGFSLSLERLLGIPTFALLYFASLIGGSLLSLYIHRNHGDYTAIGASGAVSGVILASVVLYPESSISFVILPIEIKSWIFGLAFMLISILGIKSQAGNIGHEAHLGGALTGTLLTIALQPHIIQDNWWIILLIVVPTLIFLILLIRNPAILMVRNYWGSEVTELKHRSKSLKQPKTLDQLLDKIAKKGVNSLSKREQQLLEKYRNGMK